MTLPALGFCVVHIALTPSPCSSPPRLENSEPPALNGPESRNPGAPEDPAEQEEDGSEDEWEQVGPRNKSSVTRQADFVRTPITDIFGGHIR